MMDKERVKQELNQCPCCAATKCAMDEPCLGCETYSQWLSGSDEVAPFRQVKSGSLIKCPVCSGRGEIPARDDGLIPVSGSGEMLPSVVPCPACKGYGMVREDGSCVG